MVTMLMEPLLQLFDAHVRGVVEKRDDVQLVDTTFAQLTTLHLGGRPAHTLRCTTRDAVVDIVQLLDKHNIPFLVVGGGSNLVIADGDIPLIAVIVACDEIYLDKETGELEADAGAVWDTVVSLSVDQGMGGIECLSGIPGSAGATPVQNVGAYNDGLSAPLRFGELARVLNVSVNEIEARRLATTVRAEVLRLRKKKGMVYNPDDHDTWSAGSFFTNPIVSPEVVQHVRTVVEKLHGADDAAAMPCFDASGGRKKLSAAWLIERAGYPKGYPEDGPARLSTKHTLALTNRGSATTEDLVELARTVRNGVEKTFGVSLAPEPVWVGVSL